MSDPKPEPPKRPATFATPTRAPNPPSSSAVRQRFNQRQSSGQNGSISPRRGLDDRRPSVLSFSSLDEVSRSLSEDLINPATSRASNMRDNDEVTHWHSTPLAFAILPAIGGVLFKNGSAFITDILLLALAAIFMNWSVRLPWDWYYSAQAQLRVVSLEEDAISDEVVGDEIAVESASSAGNSPKQSGLESPAREGQSPSAYTEKRERAAVELRTQETLALLATFAFPVLAAYLLHAIRAQLSNTSTALVSDFNLAIFVLAAEIRPAQQLIRLVSSRTLHLQRVVTGSEDPFSATVQESAATNSLRTRLDELEAKLADLAAAQPNGTIARTIDVTENVNAEIKKRCEPRFDALERAMRRYEKRSATLNMLTEQRLNTHDSRIQDSLSLAAVAAQQSRSRGIIATTVDSIATLILIPVRAAVTIAMSPFLVTNAIYVKLRGALLGNAPPKPAKRGPIAMGKEERLRDKALSRKTAR